MIKFYCQCCGVKIGAEKERAGETARCPSCGTDLQVPIAKEPALEMNAVKGCSENDKLGTASSKAQHRGWRPGRVQLVAICVIALVLQIKMVAVIAATVGRGIVNILPSESSTPTLASYPPPTSAFPSDRAMFRDAPSSSGSIPFVSGEDPNSRRSQQERAIADYQRQREREETQQRQSNQWREMNGPSMKCQYCNGAGFLMNGTRCKICGGVGKVSRYGNGGTISR